MAFRINKTSKIIFAISIVILSGALGFLLWRVNQEETTAPGEGLAGETECCCPDQDDNCVDCICVYTQGYCEYSPKLPVCDETWNCYEGSDCNDEVSCEWPSVAYCNLGKCECKSGDNGCTNSSHCSVSCPSGYDLCTGSSCKDSIEVTCEGECSGCGNAYYYAIECVKEPEPSCGDGKVDSGEECDYKASPTGCKTGSTCTNKCKCEAIAVVEDTCGDGKLDTGEQCESGNPTGTSCLWADCDQTSCLCLTDLNISKTVVESCIDEGTENPKAQLMYTVRVRNSSTVEGEIAKIEDLLDSKILTASIIPTEITGGGVYSSGKIVWDYLNGPISVGAGETKTYTYKVVIDKDHFGTYSNEASLFTPSSENPLKANASIIADCVVTIPQTGIFDSTLGRILAGVTLLIVGSIVYNIPNRVLVIKEKDKVSKYRIRFEKKVANR